MTYRLTPKEYQVTKMKLAQLEVRLAALRERTDLHPSHKTVVEHSYLDMIGQYRREMKLYEATHKIEEQESTVPPAGQAN